MFRDFDWYAWGDLGHAAIYLGNNHWTGWDDIGKFVEADGNTVTVCDYNYFLGPPEKHYSFWGARTAPGLTWLQRNMIVAAALAQQGCGYEFLDCSKIKKCSSTPIDERNPYSLISACGRSDGTFRCDGLVEFAYEKAGVNGGGGFFSTSEERGCIEPWTPEMTPEILFWRMQPATFSPPNISGVEPADGARLSGVVTLSCTVDDGYYGSGVEIVQFVIGPEGNDQLLGQDDHQENISGPYRCDNAWDTQTWSDGTYEVHIHAWDQAGNFADKLLHYTIDNRKPPHIVGMRVAETDAAPYNGAPGFWRWGTPAYWHDEWGGGDEGHVLWTYNNDLAHGIDNMGDWRPNLPENHWYRIDAFITDLDVATTNAARYEVYHADGRTDVVIDQYAHFNAWAYLGSYRFDAGTSGFVRLADMTTEAYGATKIAYDTVWWEWIAEAYPATDLRPRDGDLCWPGVNFTWQDNGMDDGSDSWGRYIRIWRVVNGQKADIVREEGWFANTDYYWTLPGPGEYEWKVYTSNGYGQVGHSTPARFVVVPEARTPSGLSPANGEVVQRRDLGFGNVYLSWTDNRMTDGSVSWGFKTRVWSVVGGQRSAVIHESGWLPGSWPHVYWTAPGPGEYEWTVTAADGYGQEAQSSPARFVVAPVALPPTLVSPAEGQIRDDWWFFLIWHDNGTDAGGNCTSFHLQVWEMVDGVRGDLRCDTHVGLFTHTDWPIEEPGCFLWQVSAATSTSEYSEPAVGHFSIKVKAPSNLTASRVSNEAVRLAWTGSGGPASGYRVERRDGTGEFHEVAAVPPDAMEWTDSAAPPTTACAYRIRAYFRHASWTSDWSNVAECPPGNSAPVTGTVSPKSGSVKAGVVQTFTVTCQDPDGHEDISECRILLNTNLTLADGICLRFDLDADRIYLRDDADTAWLGGFAPGSDNTIENSRCAVNCAYVSAVGDGVGITISCAVMLKPIFGGKYLEEWLYVSDRASRFDGWDRAGRIYVPSEPPTNISVHPAVGLIPAGQETTFTTIQRDVNGSQDLGTSYLLVNNVESGVGAVYTLYDARTNKLYLRNDSNSSWLGGFAPGSSNSIENSRARLQCSATTVTRDADTLTTNWRLYIKPAMVGRKCLIWMYARDLAYLNTGFEKKGEITFVSSAPTNTSVSPGNGLVPVGAHTFTTVQSDANGHADLKCSYLLFNKAVSGAGAVYTWYDRTTNTLWLRDDANNAWLGGYAPGSANTIENSRAKLICSATTVSGNANTLTIGWRLEMKPTMRARKCGVWLYAADMANQNTGFEKKGEVTFGAPPACASLAPSAGDSLAVGTKTTLTASFTDADGSGDIRSTYLVLNTALSSFRGISLCYDAAANNLYLRNDLNTAWLGGVAPGSPGGVIQNSYCRINCAATAVERDGNNLRVNWSIEPKSPMQGKTLKAWMYVIDAAGVADGYDQMASYLIGAGGLNVSVSPINTSVSTGSTTTLTTRCLAPNGKAATSTYLLMNSAIDPRGGVYVYYDGPNNRMYLRNDSGTAWLGGHAPGSPNTISNGAVTVTCASGTAAMVGDQLEVRWSVRFKQTMAPRTINAWMYTLDTTGLKDGWDLMGSVTIGQ